jgi:capsular polysaccharide biosynthesis protein
MNIENNDFLSALRFLKYLRKHIALVVLSTAAFSLAAYYVVKRTFSYESSVHFIVNNLPMPDITGDERSIGTNLELQRGNSPLIFYSTEVIEKLMEKYDLFSVYSVNPNQPHSQQKLIKKIRSSIDVKFERVNGYYLTVSGHDREMSALIANGVMEETDALIRKLMEDEFARKIAMMNNLIIRSHENAGDSNATLTQNIRSLEQLVKVLDLQKAKSSEQKDLETRMYNVLALLQQNLESMTRARDYYEIVMKNYMSDGFRFFYVISKATPDYRNYFISNVTISFAIGFGITMLATMVVYYVRRQLSYLSVLGLYNEGRKRHAREPKREELEETGV